MAVGTGAGAAVVATEGELVEPTAGAAVVPAAGAAVVLAEGAPVVPLTGAAVVPAAGAAVVAVAGAAVVPAAGAAVVAVAGAAVVAAPGGGTYEQEEHEADCDAPGHRFWLASAAVSQHMLVLWHAAEFIGRAAFAAAEKEAVVPALAPVPHAGKATALKPDAADPPGRHPFRHTGVCG